jgi:hypothetical protein
MITVSIDLTKIPKEQIVEKNGKKYLNVVVDTRREADQYGNTHTVYMSQTKEQREQKHPKVYIGSGKEYVFNNTPTYTQTTHDNNPANGGAVDDLPF